MNWKALEEDLDRFHNEIEKWLKNPIKADDKKKSIEKTKKQ